MIDIIKEMYFRFKLRKYTKRIQSGTLKRKALRDLQAKDTIARETYELKLKLIKEA